jgi:MSHA pilin protein MshC
MIQTRSIPAPGRLGGFSLVELVTVLVIIGILAAVAVPAVASFSGSRSAVAAQRIARDLSFARHLATSSGRRTWAVFSVPANSFAVLAEPTGSPGRVNAITCSDPGTGLPLTCTLNADPFAGVSLVSVSFDSGSEVGFDWLGRPLDSAGAQLSAPGVVSLSGGQTVTIAPGSGRISTP